MRTEILDPNPDTLLRAVDSANCHHALHGIVKSFFDLIDSAWAGDCDSSFFNHANNIKAKPRKRKKKVQLFSCTILLVSRAYTFVNPGLYLLRRAKLAWELRRKLAWELRRKLARELSLFFRKCLIVNDLRNAGRGRCALSPWYSTTYAKRHTSPVPTWEV